MVKLTHKRDFPFFISPCNPPAVSLNFCLSLICFYFLVNKFYCAIVISSQIIMLFYYFTTAFQIDFFLHVAKSKSIFLLFYKHTLSWQKKDEERKEKINSSFHKSLNFQNENVIEQFNIQFEISETEVQSCPQLLKGKRIKKAEI